MLCQHCNQKQATTYYSETINGEKREMALCNDCAKELSGSMNWFDPFSLGFDQLFPKMFSSMPISHLTGEQEESHCPFCGASLRDISESGKIGCSQCYREFFTPLLPSIRRIHGGQNHVGKVPSSAGISAKNQNRRNDLESKLRKAVELQDYEQAAVLRDRIKELEDQENDHE